MVERTAFEVIRELEQHFHQASKSLPAQVDYKPRTVVLCFRVAGVDLAIPLDQVAEVQEVPEYTHLPRVKAWMLGVAAIRGKLVPIIDFAAFFGEQRKPVVRNQRIVVVVVQTSYLGLLVDDVIGVRHFESDQYSLVGKQAPSFIESYVNGCYTDESGQPKFMFRPFKLVEDERFCNVAM